MKTTTHLGLGWLVSNEEFQEMKEKAGLTWDEIKDHFYAIDKSNDESEYFIGVLFPAINSGSALDLIVAAQNINQDIDQNIFGQTYFNILQTCGRELNINSKWTNAHAYLINRLA